MEYKVSIIIPVYNVEPYIEDCLQSVANQTMTEGVECILVDDCGTDNSIQIAQKFVDTYQGNISFAILHHDQNRGLSAARNTGIRNSNGEYLFFLDSDDTLVEDCIENLICLKNKYPGIDLIQGRYVRVTRPFLESFPYTRNQRKIKRVLLDYDKIPVNAQNKLVRKQLIIEHNLWFRPGIIHEDNHWNFFLAKAVNSFVLCEKKTYNYFVNPGSICNTKNKEKEILSYDIIIKDYCRNIDKIEVGSQKRCLALLYKLIIKNKYYRDDNHLQEIRHCVENVHNGVERFLLNKWIQQNNDVLAFRFFQLLLFVYKFSAFASYIK